MLLDLVAVLSLVRAVNIQWFLISAGLADVPSGAVCMSSSQVLAYRQGAARIERRHVQREEHSLSPRKSIVLFVELGFLFLPLVRTDLCSRLFYSCC